MNNYTNSEIVSKVKLWRYIIAIGKSWGSLLLGIGIFVGIFYGTYALLERFAPGSLWFFHFAITIVIIVIAALIVFNEWLVVSVLGAKRIRNQDDSQRLWDSVQRVSGELLVVPRVYLVPVSGRNAMAFGLGLPYCSAVAATRGLLNALNDEQLDAVMAHEVGHVSNKDLLLSMFVTMCVMAVTLTGYLMHTLWPLGMTGGAQDNDEKKGGWLSILLRAIILPLIGTALYWLGKAMGPFLEAFISRAREYGADAYSARIMGSGVPLIEALTIVIREPLIARGEGGVNSAIGFLCTVDPSKKNPLLSTHPSLSDRVAALKSLEE